MKFVSINELQSKSATVWRQLDREQELVVTSRGKPIAIVSATDEAHFEQSLHALRQARTLRAATRLQEESVRCRRDTMAEPNIDREVAAARK